MRIAQLAPLAESVPPKGYGGTELVVSQLTEELVRRGHEVTLFATADSETKADLVSSFGEGLRAAGVPAHRWSAYEMAAVIELAKRQNEFDIVHNHAGYLPFPHLLELDCKVVSTNHNPVAEHLKDVFFHYRQLPFVAISDAYRRLNYPKQLNYVGRVYNAVDTTVFKPLGNATGKIGEQNREYLLFLGRVSHAKGTKEAIQLAKAVSLPLKIAGKIDNVDRAYFEEHVQPALDCKIEYVGEVNKSQKSDLYAGAKAVIYPINFEEPFGLVMVEALASGTPVVALDRGSVKEILIDGKNAVIGKSVDELISRFGEVEEMTSRDCLDRAKHFSVSRMVDGYEDVYTKLLRADEVIPEAQAREAASAF